MGLREHKLFQSRDVVFNEDCMYKDWKAEKDKESKEKEYMKLDETDEEIPKA